MATASNEAVLRDEKSYRGHLLNMNYVKQIGHLIGIGVIESATGNALYTYGNIQASMPPFFLAMRQFSGQELQDEFDYFEGSRMRIATKYNDQFGVVVVFDEHVEKHDVKEIAQYLHEECVRSYERSDPTQPASEFENFGRVIEVDELKAEYEQLMRIVEDNRPARKTRNRPYK